MFKGVFPKPQETRALLENNANEQLPETLRFEKGTYLPVPCRASIVRFAFMKLSGTGLLAAWAAASTSNNDARLGCALSAAVNFVAALHYFNIWYTRAQNYPPGYSDFALTVGAKTANTAEKMHAQELYVDGLRHSDWAITLILMTIELHKLADNAAPDRSPYLIKELASGLQPVFITVASIGRFLCNECRRDKNGNWPSASILLLGISSYLIATGIWVFTTVNLLQDVGPITNMTDFQSRDATAVYVISLTQIGYPLVTLVSILWLNFVSRDLNNADRPMPGSQYSSLVSTVKDTMYATLDITTKAGLALYVALRTQWV